MSRNANPDLFALEVLLSNRPAAEKQKTLKKASRARTAVLEGRVTCPDCGHKGPHDQNERGTELACSGCGLHFEVNTWGAS